MFFFLFALVVLISLYDLKYRKLPNWITLPLILLGLYLSFPGDIILWITSCFLFSAWNFSSFGESVALWMFAALMLTGLAQIVVRALSQKRVAIDYKTAGAWRAVVFMGLLAYLH